MAVLLSHPTGNQNVRAVLRSLQSLGQLHTFWTSIALPLPDAGRATALPLSRSVSRKLAQRAFPEVPWHSVRLDPLRETLRLFGRAVGLKQLIHHETGWASVDRVYTSLDKRVAAHLLKGGTSGLRLVYAYEDGALASFRAARRMGLHCVYDLPIAHWLTGRELMAEEAELKPAWRSTMEGLLDSPEKCARKDEEIALAHVICVASSFTANSLRRLGQTDRDIRVIPYGAPAPRCFQVARRMPGEPLRVFYAGHLSQRKGLAYLIDALRRLDVPWHLTLAGPRPTHAPAQLDLFLSDPRCNWLGVVPHPTLMESMQQAHVFVFPSLVEGFGLVLTEALSNGLPIITTANTAGPDLIEQGCQGYIVPIRNPDAITDRLTFLYEHEDVRFTMAQSALQRAAELSWKRYEAGVGALLTEVLQSRGFNARSGQ